MLSAEMRAEGVSGVLGDGCEGVLLAVCNNTETNRKSQVTTTVLTAINQYNGNR